MLKNRREAAQKVADSLFAAEEAIDAALARAAELNRTLAIARQEAKLSAVFGQDVFANAATTFAALATARAEIVETHKRLEQAQIQAGLRAVSFGDHGKPTAATGPGRLHAVS